MELIDQTVPATERGDLLIFMSGIQEISTLADSLRLFADHTKWIWYSIPIIEANEQIIDYAFGVCRHWIILILHSSLSVEEQDKVRLGTLDQFCHRETFSNHLHLATDRSAHLIQVFDFPPEGTRKCIISSNISETSVTIDGIRFIIDSGKAKELTHETNANLSKLSEFWISKASATQRAGRAGRTGPGVCYRLYSIKEFNHFNDFAVPEILRAPLEPVVMQIKALELGDPREFDFVEVIIAWFGLTIWALFSFYST
ncbi:P-loop containing nucleoside triphosphate hydrolase protein [Jimgerdemannia flammicorona]|uniref:P-loop containing nucleoside triphosphate hydrolase protein n=1 Tax=Jimgerdemannia flammicorona TaxID=994334 RepID=A0A433D5T0_9FUNG|nr:P-loop containing nucleoside triphosphate hydrolase protein [Jimgerdemannia flammicorona]